MIVLDRVVKAYGNRPPALEECSLHIEKGEMVFITGPSGAGKSTLLRLVHAGDAPTSGRILIQNTDITRLRPSSLPYLRRNIGVVFQDFKLIPSRSVGDNVGLALEVLSAPPKDIRRRVASVLARVGLTHRTGARPNELSGGEQQRVAIARAIVNDPSIVLADEPTGNLDSARSLEILELLHDVNLKGTTLLIATHDTRLLEAFSARRIHMERGRIVSDSRGLLAEAPSTQASPQPLP